MNPSETDGQARFRTARDRMLAGHLTYDWPRDTSFNWALDWFDVAAPGERLAVVVLDGSGAEMATYTQLRESSNRAANWMRSLGIEAGDCMLVLMRNSVDYYVLTLAAMKLGVVLVPCFVSLQPTDIHERMVRSRAKHLVADYDLVPKLQELVIEGLRVVVHPSENDSPKGWRSLAEARLCDPHLAHGWRGSPSHPLMGFFTSGTTSRPKLVMHSHQSYPVGHLSSLYWHGTGPSDVHANVSPPGWAKHAWSSFFVPFSAEATALTFRHDRPAISECLSALSQHGVTSFCAPPSYWHAMVRSGLGRAPAALNKVVSAGEALDEELVREVQSTWGLTIRNGYGQSEATAMVGLGAHDQPSNGVLGRPLPGYESILLINPETGEPGREGEICIDLERRPIGLMLGYVNEKGKAAWPDGRYYHTGDLASFDDKGNLKLLGRTDDVFKSYDVRISPLELEQCCRDCRQIDDIAVFAVTDTQGETVPAAAVVPSSESQIDHSTLSSLFMEWQLKRLGGERQLYKVWLLDQLPRTASGKINRAELRRRFATCLSTGERSPSLRSPT